MDTTGFVQDSEKGGGKDSKSERSDLRHGRVDVVLVAVWMLVGEWKGGVWPLFGREL